MNGNDSLQVVFNSNDPETTNNNGQNKRGDPNRNNVHYRYQPVNVNNTNLQVNSNNAASFTVRHFNNNSPNINFNHNMSNNSGLPVNFSNSSMNNNAMNDNLISNNIPVQHNLFNNGNNTAMSNPENSVSYMPNSMNDTVTISKKKLATPTNKKEKGKDTEKDKKRNRLSYVCQACRRSKTKCDKSKPQCIRCYKLNITCIYDTINQIPPKNLTNEKRIKSLENELDYWQKKTKFLLQEQELHLKNKRRFSVMYNGKNNNTTDKNMNESNSNKANTFFWTNNSSPSNSPNDNFDNNTGNHKSYLNKTTSQDPLDDTNEKKRRLLKIANLVIDSPSPNNQINYMNNNDIMNINQNLKNNNNNDNNNTNSIGVDSISNSNNFNENNNYNISSIETCLDTIYSNDNFFKLNINLCQHNPRLIMSKVMKKEVNPLSGNYLMINDSFFASLLLSLFVKSKGNKYCNLNVLITVLSSEISISKTQSSIVDSVLKLKNVVLNQNLHRKQIIINRINLFFDRLLNNNDERKTIEMNKILNSMIPKINDLNDTYSESNIFEDFLNDNEKYSKILQDFINDLEDVLPPLSVILQYKQHFMENIYVLLPYFDIETFNDSIMDTLTIDPNNIQRCKINLKKFNIRQKLENVVILLLIVKISYMTLILINDGESLGNINSHVTVDILHQYPIGNEIMVFALRLLIAENWTACPNENILTILMYIWSYYVFSPDEGEIFMETGTHGISNTIIMLASAIGLHRDPLDYSQVMEYKDKRIINQRRLLWLSVISMTAFESALNGFRVPTKNLLESFININDIESYDKYISRILKDIPVDSRTREFTKDLHDMVLRRTMLSLLHQKINRLTMTYSKSVSLWEIEESLAALDKFEHETELSIKTRQKIDFNGSNSSQEDMISQLSIVIARPTLLFVTKIMNKILQVRTSYAIMIFFEDKCVNDKSYLNHFYRYFKLTIKFNLDLIKLYEKYYYDTRHDENYKRLSKLNKYYISKFLQLGLPTAMFTILVIITRLELSQSVLMTENEHIEAKTNDDKSNFSIDKVNFSNDKGNNDNLKKIEILERLSNLLKPILKKMSKTANTNLKFLYFSTFKILSIYELLIAKIQNRELCYEFFDKLKLNEMDPRMAKFLKMSFNITFTNSAESISQTINNEKLNKLNKLNLLELLKSKSHFMITPVEQLEEISDEIRKFIEGPKGVNVATPAGNNIAQCLETPSQSTVSHISASDSNAPGGCHIDLTETIETPRLLESSLNFTDIFGNLDLFNSDFFTDT